MTLDILEFDPWIPVKYKTCNPEDSLGCCWARSRIQKELFTDEDIFMQIDSHTMFKPNWDEYLLKELAKSKQWVQSPILSGYPRPFNVLETKNAFNYEKPSPVLALQVSSKYAEFFKYSLNKKIIIAINFIN